MTNVTLVKITRYVSGPWDRRICLTWEDWMTVKGGLPYRYTVRIQGSVYAPPNRTWAIWPPRTH